MKNWLIKFYESNIMVKKQQNSWLDIETIIRNHKNPSTNYLITSLNNDEKIYLEWFSLTPDLLKNISENKDWTIWINGMQSLLIVGTNSLDNNILQEIKKITIEENGIIIKNISFNHANHNCYYIALKVTFPNPDSLVLNLLKLK